MENNRQILLSIIIPVYNAEKTLRECVDSVLIQAPNNSEIILINDGSTDASKAICNQYAEENAKIKVIHQDNKGISVTRNTGLKLACGDKIVFFDSDDYLEPDFLECILSHEADLVIGNYEAFYLDDHPNIRGDFRNLQYNSLHSFLNDFHIYYPVVTNVVWGKVYKKKIIREFNLLFPNNISMGEDILFNLQYFCHCNSIYMESQSAVMYRQSANSLSKRLSSHTFEWYNQCYSEIEKILKENDAFNELNENVLYSKYFGNYYEGIIGMFSLDKKERDIRLKKIINDERVREAAKRADTHSFLYKGIKIATKNRSVFLLTTHIKIYQCLRNIKRGIFKK